MVYDRFEVGELRGFSSACFSPLVLVLLQPKRQQMPFFAYKICVITRARARLDNVYVRGIIQPSNLRLITADL